LSPGGKLAGLYFNFPLTQEGPPYGGSEEEYRKRFSAQFEIEKMYAAPNSIKPRAGRELWVEMRKK
jgi:thiopurine S-methyltransferase